MKLEHLVARTEGFSGAQIASLCNLAALKAVRRAVATSEAIPAGSGEEAAALAAAESGQRKPPPPAQVKVLIGQADLEAALTELAPSRE